LIKEIKGTEGMGVHQQNFVDAVRNHTPESLNAPVAIGHQSSAWCNFANYAYRVAQGSNGTGAELDLGIDSQAAGILDELKKLVAVHEGEKVAETLQPGPTLTFDAASEQFVGDNADKANQLLRRAGRKEFVVPEV
jgi:hypothetical protein